MNRLLQLALTASVILSFSSTIIAQRATVREEMVPMFTYPFSDPDPVPAPGRIYPWFYFNGYTATGEDREWKMVVLENNFIKVFITPEIGGKVWGAIEKSTGQEFLYYNSVVKFRDIAMRGAWTSGGLEYNFGDIGHIPTCATPVDYTTRQYPDGSVSCVVGAIDLPTGSRWNVEILLRPGRAYFETITRWYNTSDLPGTYYHWMNAAAEAGDDLEFIYPGNMHIGHGGERGSWPLENGRDISFYRNNNFGPYKSYHVINSHTDYFGGYWHDSEFGFGHWSRYDEKPGKKLWIWGLSDQGMIWEDLLTDSDGQYIEFQAGKLFNQAAAASSSTPFKHREFAPYDTDIMREMWFPLVRTGGMKAVSNTGIINIDGNDLVISALENINGKIELTSGGRTIFKGDVKLQPLELQRFKGVVPQEGNYRVSLSDGRLIFDSRSLIVERPSEPVSPGPSLYSDFVEALELEKQREYHEAGRGYQAVVKRDPFFMPALNRLGAGYLRRMMPDSAAIILNRSLSIDTYNGEANYLLGLASIATGDTALAKSCFGVAMADPSQRTAAAVVLARTYLAEGRYHDAIHYAGRALEYNTSNLESVMIMAVAGRRSNNLSLAIDALGRLDEMDPLLHFTLFERYLLTGDTLMLNTFKEALLSELSYESCLDLASHYISMGCRREASEVLENAPSYPVVSLWRAWLDTENRAQLLEEAFEADPAFVFPHRPLTAIILEELKESNYGWKPDYYLALIHWNRGNSDRAIELMNACGDSPQFSPFYSARARLLGGSDQEIKDLRRAVILDPRSWRAAVALANYYLEHDEAQRALFIEPYIELYPEQPAIGVTWANILLKSGRYGDCISFLQVYNVLPYEGATIARDIYHSAALMEGVRLTRAGEYDEAMKMAQVASEWPANLGSGKPYVVDERDIQLLLTAIERRKGNNKGYQKRLSELAAWKDHTDITPSLLLTMVAYEGSGEITALDSIVKRLEELSGKELLAEWILKLFKGDYAAADSLEEVINASTGAGNARTLVSFSDESVVRELISLWRNQD